MNQLRRLCLSLFVSIQRRSSHALLRGVAPFAGPAFRVAGLSYRDGRLFGERLVELQRRLTDAQCDAFIGAEPGNRLEAVGKVLEAATPEAVRFWSDTFEAIDKARWWPVREGA